MGRYEYEKLSLLPLNANSSNSTLNPSSPSVMDGDDNSDHDDSVEFENKKKYFRAKLSGAIRSTSSSFATHNRRKLHLNRGLCKRLTRILIYALTIPMIILAFRSAVFSGAPSRHYPLSDWDLDVSRNISDYVLPYNDTTLLEPRRKCQDKIFILIVVCSGINNFVARQTIRETWGNTTEFNYSMFEKLHAHLSGKYLLPKRQRITLLQDYYRLSGNKTTTVSLDRWTVKIVFLLGQNKADALVGAGGFGRKDNETYIRLQQEAEQYDDIVQENFLDSYNNLTIKSVMALKWITRNKCFERAAFFMKCDDDTFVNIPNLLQYLLGGTVPLYNETLDFYDSHTYQTMSALNRLNATTDFMVGYIFCKAPVVSNVKSKWYMPGYMYLKDYYPTYLSGSGYLMSMDVVPRLYEASLNTSLVYLEDVYVTGICAAKANITRHHHPLFSYGRYKNRCTLKGMITLHKLKNEEMYDAYNFVTNVTYHCPPPGKYFKRLRLRRLSGCG